MLSKLASLGLSMVFLMGFSLPSFASSPKLEGEKASVMYKQYAYRRGAVNRATPRVTATPRAPNVGPVVHSPAKAAVGPVDRTPRDPVRRATRNTIVVNNNTYNLYVPGAVRLAPRAPCYIANVGYGTFGNGACIYRSVSYTTFYVVK